MVLSHPYPFFARFAVVSSAAPPFSRLRRRPRIKSAARPRRKRQALARQRVERSTAGRGAAAVVQRLRARAALAGRRARAGARPPRAREYLEALLIAAVFLGFTNTFVVKTFYIPSPSMENTLLIGDHLFVNRFLYGPVASKLERLLLPLREVRRGDVIIFRSLENPEM